MPARPPYRYREDVLTELLRHGLRPSTPTAPQFLRDAVRDLYLFEIRRLRDRLRAGAFPKTDYARRVVELRGRYVLLSIPLEEWLEPENAPSDHAGRA